MMMMMIKFVLFLAFVVVGNVADSIKSDKSPLRVEPGYNPFWVMERTPFSVTCVKEASSKVPITWTVNGGDPKNAGLVVKNTKLRLPSGQIRSSSRLSKDVAGLDEFGPASITCETVVKKEENKEEQIISVHAFSVFVEHPNITEGEDVILKCSPDMPQATVIWSRDGHVIDNTTQRRMFEKNNQTLVLQKSRPQDSGVYQCEIQLKAGINLTTQQILTQSFTLDVNVAGKPYLQKPTSSEVDAVVNGTLTLTCPVTAFPTPDVYWLRADDSPVEPSPRLTYSPHDHIKDATLEISTMTKEDFGVYVCVAQNSVGRMVKEFRVGVSGGNPCHQSITGIWFLVCACLSVLFCKY